MHFLITGHTGFKGSWLSMLLHERGHEVSGISLEPESESLFNKAAVGRILREDIRCDIRDYKALERNFKEISPDVVIHMAAQALVLESYIDPINTFEINAMGTVNVLKASQEISNLRAQVIVTTDKVYRNIGKISGYTEEDPLGGSDPYSTSKAMSDLAAQSWLASFKNAPTAIARAGNVIGGGDYSKTRLLPDLVRSYQTGIEPKIRFPNAVRPWQHVLDCLEGYLKLVDALIAGNGIGIWNFGPSSNQAHTVAQVAEIVGETWGSKNKWEIDTSDQVYEADFLALNSEKSKENLRWENRLSFHESVSWAANWYKNVYEGADSLDETLINIREFDKSMLNFDK